MPQDTFYITLPPGQECRPQGLNAVPAHLAYCMGRGPRLLRAGGSPPPRGGVMVLSDRGFERTADWEPLCREILQECRARGFSGVILDFDRRLPPLERLAVRLEEALSRRGLSLLVPEGYGCTAQRAGVIIPSALSGGTLTQRLEDACQQFGGDRVVLALDMAAEDFSLPSPSGCGTPLTAEHLRKLRETMRPSVFFSRELCARYFTYTDHRGGAHFVLFDDGDTLCRKAETARRAGIRTFLLPRPLAEAHGAALSVPGQIRPFSHSRQGPA